MSQFSLSGKHSVVTGGSSGIGYSIAKTFSENGAHVHILDLDGLVKHLIFTKLVVYVQFMDVLIL